MVLKNLLNPQQAVSSNQEQTAIPVSRSILERMMQSSDRQLRLINSLLEVHASEVGGILLQREPVQLTELVQFLVKHFEPLLVKNQATIINRVLCELATN
jgi:signal transduction histidine kinase